MNPIEQRPLEVELRSFRDPDGHLEITGDGKVYRHLTDSGVERVRQIKALSTLVDLQQSGNWITAVEVDGDSTTLMHPRIFFPSYPAEWSPSMLHRAAALTLKANLSLLREGWELKDASPSNIMFDGTRPIFVDHLSPIRRPPGQRGWGAYGQFCRTFLIPLLLGSKRRIPMSWIFQAHRDGVPPEQALPILLGLGILSPAVFRLVTLPALLKNRTSPLPHRSDGQNSEVGDLVTQSILKGLGRELEGLRPRKDVRTRWTDYQDQGVSYTPQSLAAKTEFINRCLARCRPSSVLDIGCNAGKYSLAAARAGAKVVALDGDAMCIDRLFKASEAEGLDILPIVVNLACPSPPRGWNYREELSLLSRLSERFDLTLALALVHHLLVRERIPLKDVVVFLAATTCRHLLLEWVPPTDPQFRSLAGNDMDTFAEMTWPTVAVAFMARFTIIEDLSLPGSQRSLHLLERQ